MQARRQCHCLRRGTLGSHREPLGCSGKIETNRQPAPAAAIQQTGEHFDRDEVVLLVDGFHGTSKHQLIQEERLHRASFVPVLVGLAGMLLHIGLRLSGNERFGLVASSFACLKFGVSMPAATWGVLTFAWYQISMYNDELASWKWEGRLT